MIKYTDLSMPIKDVLRLINITNDLKRLNPNLNITADVIADIYNTDKTEDYAKR